MPDIAVMPVDVEAWAYSLLRDLGGVTLWAFDSSTAYPYRTQVTSLQVDVRASSKQRARDRATVALFRLLDPDATPPPGGVVAEARPITGPFWLPDDNGAPRYVLRIGVTAHPQAQTAPTNRRRSA